METVGRLIRSKTTWVALAGIFSAVGAYVAGEIGGVEAVKLVFFGMLTITGRDAWAKGR